MLPHNDYGESDKRMPFLCVVVGKYAIVFFITSLIVIIIINIRCSLHRAFSCYLVYCGSFEEYHYQSLHQIFKPYSQESHAKAKKFVIIVENNEKNLLAQHRQQTPAHTVYYLFWLKSPSKKKRLFWRNYRKGWKYARERMKIILGWNRTRAKAKLFFVSPLFSLPIGGRNRENSVVSEAELACLLQKSWNVDYGWKNEKGRESTLGLWNVEQSESEYWLEWEVKIQSGRESEDALFKFTSLYNRSWCWFWCRCVRYTTKYTNRRNFLGFVIILITLYLRFTRLHSCSYIGICWQSKQPSHDITTLF